MDDFVAESATPQQMSKAVKSELSQIESKIKDLPLTSFEVEQHTVNDRAIKDLWIYTLTLTLRVPTSSCWSYRKRHTTLGVEAEYSIFNTEFSLNINKCTWIFILLEKSLAPCVQLMFCQSGLASEPTFLGYIHSHSRIGYVIH